MNGKQASKPGIQDWDNGHQQVTEHLVAHTGMWHRPGREGMPDVCRIPELTWCSNASQEGSVASMSTVFSEDHLSSKPFPWPGVLLVSRDMNMPDSPGRGERHIHKL